MNVTFLSLLIIFCLLKNSKSWIIRTSVIFYPTSLDYRGFGPLFAKKKKKKTNRTNVTIECSISRKLGLPPSRYFTTKNKVNTPQRLELMKYNKYLKRHTLHKEIR